MNPLIWQFEQYEALNLIFLPSLVLDLDPILYPAHKNSEFSDDLISRLINPPGLWESFLLDDSTRLSRSRWETRRERKRVCSIIETTFLNSRFLFRENLFGRIIYDTPQTFSQCQNAFEIGPFQCNPRKCYFWQVHLIKLNWYAVIWDNNFAWDGKSA